jgi:DNA repair protein RadC
MPSSNLIREMPEHDRPRERLERLGPESLTDAELLAVLLRTGSRGISAVQLGEELIRRFGGLEQLARQSVAEIAKVNGIGKAKATLLKAAFALHERAYARLRERRPLNHPKEIHAVMAERMYALNVEVLYGLALDSKLNLIRSYEISSGLLNQTLIHAREAYRGAIAASAAHLVLVHNHPSGDPSPSADDVRITRQMLNVGEVLGIPLIDHVIIGRASSNNPNGYVSLKQTGVVDFGRAAAG